MEWQTVNRKGGGKGWNHGVQDQLMQSMTAMQNSISQLAQSICTRPPPGSKGQGKGKPSKGQGKGVKSSPGERKSPNLKPEEDRAEPTGQGSQVFPRGTKKSQPQARGGQSRTYNRGSEMPEVSKLSNDEVNLDNDNDRRGVKHKSKEGSEMRTGRIR